MPSAKSKGRRKNLTASTFFSLRSWISAEGWGSRVPRSCRSALILKSLPKPHQDWVKKVKDEMQLPDVEIMVRMNSTTMRPKEAIQVCIEEKVPLFCAGLGNPGFMAAEAHAAGMKVLGITGNAKNAKRMAQSGIDLLVAQGHEGGGHTGRIGTMALLPQAIDAAYPVPVLAAGGIGDGRGLAAALAIGCIGAWVGTRFLATVEGGALPVNKKHILDSTDEDTRVSKAYTGKTLRASYNKFHDLWDGSGLEPLPFPTQVSDLLGPPGESCRRQKGRIRRRPGRTGLGPDQGNQTRQTGAGGDGGRGGGDSDPKTSRDRNGEIKFSPQRAQRTQRKSFRIKISQ